MRSPSLSRTAGAAVLAAMLAACSSTSSTSTTSATSATGAPSDAASAVPAASGATIKIGMDFPLSGQDAAVGRPSANGALLAIEQANAAGFAGGKYTLSAVILDDTVQGKHDPAAGAQNVKTLIADPSVLAMVGPYNSNVAKAEIPLTNDAELVQISPANTNDGLTTGDDAKKLRTAHPDVNSYFRVCTRDSRQGLALAQFARKLGWHKVYVIDDNETYGKGLADVFDPSFQKLGGTVLGHDHITANQQDFKALLTKIKAQHPDAVFYGGDVSTGGALLREQMADVGMSATPFMGGDGIGTSEFLKVAGPMANQTYYSIAAPDAAKLPSASAFVAAYRKRFGSDIGAYSANSYTAAKIEIAAIEKAIAANGGKMPTRADVRNEVAATKGFASPIGTIGFDADGDTTAPILTLKKVQDGKPITYDQLVLKT
ncbi:MAG TPA: branched-chain amino acid ABC transporter substrate-binding protein [Candidatus Baltobacteraceae bacterium]|nr:branched-chain amino acid ABC transporter substrate-binding protein [Candidatus Baltobacteraceae bacterium]